MSESHLDLWWETAANTQQDRQAEPFYAKYVDTHTTGVCLEWEFYFYYRFLIFHRSSFYTDILSGWLYYNYFCTNIFTTIDRLWNVNKHVVSETPWVHPKDRRWKHRLRADHQPLNENKHCFLTAFHLMWDSSPAFSQWAHHTEVIIWKRRKTERGGLNSFICSHTSSTQQIC